MSPGGQVRFPLFVTGNHERVWTQYTKDIFAENGVTVLSGTTAPFAVGSTSLYIGGVDDPTIDAHGADRLRFPEGPQFNLLLAHDPLPLRGGYDRTGAKPLCSVGIRTAGRFVCRAARR